MGYIVSKADIPDLIPGTLGLELRSESVVITTGDGDWAEIEYRELGRLSQMIEHAIEKGLKEGLLDDVQ